MGRSRKARGGRRTADRRGRPVDYVEASLTGVVEEFQTHHETSPRLSGGDLDADWLNAHLSGEEAVGGSVATPDQDVVDEIGRALGVEEELDAEFRPVDEVFRQRDRRRWELEEEAAAEEEEEA